MSWIEKLYETYECCDGAPQFENEPLLPLCHVYQQAHIEVVISKDSRCRGARVLQRTEQRTSIACTEDSASRCSNDAPHALCDKLQYCASDYEKRGGRKKPCWKSYSDQLKNWCSSPFAHPKANAVLAYLQGGSLLEDLISEKIVVANQSGRLLDTWTEDGPLPPLLKLLTAKQGRRDQGDALVRWRVEIPGDVISALWEDADLQASWVKFCASREARLGVCFVSGRQRVALASKHRRGIRWSGDGAKLISSNDDSGYTFRGRFSSGDEACGVGFEVSQKAHNALRWLVARQGDAGKTVEQMFVSWSTGGQSIPDPLKNTAQLFHDTPPGDAAEPQYQGDAGQLFASRLNRLIAGYTAKLGPTQSIIVMGLDSATPGRMAIIFYRELTGSEFLSRVLAWHTEHAWEQNYSSELRFLGAPAPKDIAEAAYGRRLDDKLRKWTVERLIPCIIDGEPVPRDLVESAVRRVCNRVGLKSWEWEKCLGIACSLYRGWRKKENYQMSLEESRTSRDYLFGRLLAIADHLEQRALHVAGENRETNAARMMQRFADHPCSTWRNIRHALLPYEARLRSKRPPLLHRLNVLIDDVMGKFQTNEFADDGKLSGEYLLGFHCQRSALWQKPENTRGTTAEETGEL
ncbi:MAG TPA: type I-C CRISPR-associated protein Cas8c/Csd1 [Candidatus Sulfotelmatobacter sp.]